MEYKHLLPKFATDTRKLWTRSGGRQAIRDNLDKINKMPHAGLRFRNLRIRKQKSRAFVIHASRGFVLAAGIEQPYCGNVSNGVPCLMSGIQRFASLCPMCSGPLLRRHRRTVARYCSSWRLSGQTLGEIELWGNTSDPRHPPYFWSPVKLSSASFTFWCLPVASINEKIAGSIFGILINTL